MEIKKIDRSADVKSALINALELEDKRAIVISVLECILLEFNSLGYSEEKQENVIDKNQFVQTINGLIAELKKELQRNVKADDKESCNYLRNQEECACPAGIKNLKDMAPTIYDMGYRRVGGDVCIYAQDNSFEQCSYRQVKGEEE